MEDQFPASHTDWVAFENNSAVLRRFIRANGEEGILLQFAASSSAGRLRQRAVEFGFRESGDGNSLVLDSASSQWPVAPAKLAACLGGRLATVARDRLHAYPFTLDYRHSRRGRPIPKGIISGTEQVRQLGQNFRGEDVFVDSRGSRFRKLVSAEGVTTYDVESRQARPGEFLRARHADDMESIAAGLFQMARRGMVTDLAIDTVVKAACEPAEGVDDALDVKEMARLARHSLTRRIIDIAAEDGGSRKAYHKAMRLARHTAGLLDEEEEGPCFAPSTNFLIFLRRITLGISEIDVSGSARLAMGLPPIGSSEGAAVQLHDLFAIDGARLVERVQNTLARRDPEGLSMFVMRGEAACEANEAVRHAVGRAHVLEIVAELMPHIATGHHDGSPVTMMFVGGRRQKVDVSLHMAARRTFKVAAIKGLDELYREIIRSRKRILHWKRSIVADELDQTDELEDNQRQRRYTPLSRLSVPFTMISKALEAATAKSLRRAAREYEASGGVDRAIASSLGMSREALSGMLLAEQVDAVALRMVAARRRRAFLLADQTGIGKGRSLAAMARLHLRADGNVIYFTENCEINIPDVWRDLAAVGALAEVDPVILAARPLRLQYPVDMDSDSRREDCRTLPKARRKQLLESCCWPEGCNLLLTNYSQFRGKSDSLSRKWARKALDPETMIILDESQNAINPRSNTGAAIRDMLDMVKPYNVVFASATPVRSQEEISLYRPLLPRSGDSHLIGSLSRQIGGNAVAQETFTTMLAEDGVMLRRDHDLSNVEFDIRLPDDTRMGWYQEVMDLASQLLERVLDCSLRIGDLIGHRQSTHYLNLLRDGFDEATARAQSNALNQYSPMPGGILARLARLIINSIKIEQVIEETQNEINQGRKPLITFYSTGAQLFQEHAAAGRVGDTDEPLKLTLADQINRVIDTIYYVRVADQRCDARRLDTRFAAMADEISALIAALPEELPASPIDALHEGLAEKGISSDEITGRHLAYRKGRILRIDSRNRKKIVDAFNDGSTDVLLYNQAGATGGSYHASPGFKDQRPRTLIEMETPLDIIRYIQAQGRGNRYGQVARPRVVSVSTGLIPEMRILQQRNRKLRVLGASVDGNRSHPLLLDDIPDLLNRIGDQATTQVLETNPDLARRLGFWSLLGDPDSELSIDRISSAADAVLTRRVTDSVANRVLSRSIVLNARDQSRLVDLIKFEFDAIVEELESRGENPLRPRELTGEIEIHGQSLFSGLETDRGDLDVSAFHAPLYVSTGIHHFSEEAISPDAMQAMVNQAKVSDGTEGFATHADIVEMNLPGTLRPLLPTGVRYEDAVENLADQPFRFRNKHRRLNRLIFLLRNIRPGRVLQFDQSDIKDNSLRTIVKLNSPDQKFADMPQAYRVRAVSPGASRPETISVSRLIALPNAAVRFQIGIESGANLRHMREFARQITVNRKAPVQILSGNHLTAMQVAATNQLGVMTLYRDNEGTTHRGIVVYKNKVDLTKLPAIVPSGKVTVQLLHRLASKELEHPVFLWSGKRDEPRVIIRFTRLPTFSGLRGYFRFPKRIAGRSQSESERRISEILAEHGRNAYEGVLFVPMSGDLCEIILDNLDGFLIYADSHFRDLVNTISRDLKSGTLAEGPSLDQVQFVR